MSKEITLLVAYTAIGGRGTFITGNIVFPWAPDPKSRPVSEALGEIKRLIRARNPDVYPETLAIMNIVQLDGLLLEAEHIAVAEEIQNDT